MFHILNPSSDVIHHYTMNEILFELLNLFHYNLLLIVYLQLIDYNYDYLLFEKISLHLLKDIVRDLDENYILDFLVIPFFPNFCV